MDKVQMLFCMNHFAVFKCCCNKYMKNTQIENVDNAFFSTPGSKSVVILKCHLSDLSLVFSFSICDTGFCVSEIFYFVRLETSSDFTCK